MIVKKVIPVLRIFDYEKAREFYLGWLDFKIDWEHRFEAGAPLYVQISRGDITLHLSEHHGDGTPGTHVLIQCSGVKDFHAEITAKQYKYNRPGIQTAPWNALVVEVNDPFNNRLIFNEALD